MSIVEETLRSQRDAWVEISERVLRSVVREFPMETPKRILLFGAGSSHYAARLTGYAIIRDRTRLRVPVIACESPSIGVEVTPARGDWAFAFSHRGKTPSTVQGLELCDREGAFTMLVASTAAEMPKSARVHVATSAPEKVEPHTLAVTGAICAVTSLLLGERAREEWEAIRSVGDPNFDLMRERAGRGPDAILGEWEAQWLAREGALKLMEMARAPVRAFGTEEFFHGPRASLGPGSSIWHVSHPKDPRNGQFEAALEVRISGSSALAWVPSLVELQWLALAAALNRGIDPDLQPDSRGSAPSQTGS